MSSIEPSTERKHEVYHTSAFHAAGEAIMSFAPVNAIHQHLCTSLLSLLVQGSAHFLASQCVIYDSDQPNARLIGIEYIIPRKTFEALDAEEKRYWHSHKYEVESGMLVLQTKSLVPNAVNDTAEQPAMLELQDTYGKTIHTWAPDIHAELPLGPPNLMMSFTGPGVVDETKLRERDEKLGISTEAKRKLRAGYLPHTEEPAEGCDIGDKSGKTVVFIAKDVDMKA
ncbi:hypothetical protein HWV62_11227 [Athelia sp. TMB]|nr:hypothetical protein HWV62_11227 [Athelia sp. TMB]